ncbi:MAG: GNAT family N-acetyltransferase [Cyanobacteria bacterium J06576_12]
MLFKGRREREELDLLAVEIVPLDGTISVNSFDCGAPPLNKFLKNRAKKVTRRFESSVFCAVIGTQKRCIGYYALQVGSDTLPPGNKRKRQDFSKEYIAFPAITLQWLAVDERVQGQGLGKYLLMNIFERLAEIAKQVGFYALTLQSYDERSTRFYRGLDFEEYSEGGTHPKMLYPLQRIIKLVEER